MTTPENLYTWKETTTEYDIVKEYTLDVGDGLVFNRLIFNRSDWASEWNTYSVEYNGVEIKNGLDNVFYEGDGYWYGFNSKSMFKYHFDKLIFEIKACSF